MKSHEALIGEAVASLTARLESWHVDDAATRAHEYVHDMLRAGWRPTARPAGPPPDSGDRCPDPIPYIQQARDAIRRHREGGPDGAE